jgi:hypothetical protein
LWLFQNKTLKRKLPAIIYLAVRAKKSMEIFLGHIPVPMVVPGEEYGKRRPWFFSPE